MFSFFRKKKSNEPSPESRQSASSAQEAQPLLDEPVQPPTQAAQPEPSAPSGAAEGHSGSEGNKAEAPASFFSSALLSRAEQPPAPHPVHPENLAEPGVFPPEMVEPGASAQPCPDSASVSESESAARAKAAPQPKPPAQSKPELPPESLTRLQTDSEPQPEPELTPALQPEPRLTSAAPEAASQTVARVPPPSELDRKSRAATQVSKAVSADALEAKKLGAAPDSDSRRGEQAAPSAPSANTDAAASPSAERSDAAARQLQPSVEHVPAAELPKAAPAQQTTAELEQDEARSLQGVAAVVPQPDPEALAQSQAAQETGASASHSASAPAEQASDFTFSPLLAKQNEGSDFLQSPPDNLDAEAVQPMSNKALRASWTSRLRSGLARTGASIGGIFAGAKVDEALFEELEMALIMADAGVDATESLLKKLRQRVKKERLSDPAQVREALLAILTEHLKPLEKTFMIPEDGTSVVMVTGVNGAGKTTSLGKLAYHFQAHGAKVLLAAGDTFRAAAREQLIEWGARNHVDVIAQSGGDPAAVAFDAVNAGRARQANIVMVDTAGRLPTQLHLMEELKKVKRVIGKAEAQAPHEILLVVDGNTGQNVLTQIKAFDAALGLTGLIVTKLDGTAKGGTLAAVAAGSQGVRPVPVYWIGVGETLYDLQPFNAAEFAAALLGESQR